METVSRKSILGRFGRFGVVGLAVGVMGVTTLVSSGALSAPSAAASPLLQPAGAEAIPNTSVPAGSLSADGGVLVAGGADYSNGALTLATTGLNEPSAAPSSRNLANLNFGGIALATVIVAPAVAAGLYVRRKRAAFGARS